VRGGDAIVPFTQARLARLFARAVDPLFGIDGADSQVNFANRLGPEFDLRGQARSVEDPLAAALDMYECRERQLRMLIAEAYAATFRRRLDCRPLVAMAALRLRHIGKVRAELPREFRLHRLIPAVRHAQAYIE
jgi:hypothetical protein